jgi:hypothetical protein
MVPGTIEAVGTGGIHDDKSSATDTWEVGNYRSEDPRPAAVTVVTVGTVEMNFLGGGYGDHVHRRSYQRFENEQYDRSDRSDRDRWNPPPLII